MLELPSTCIGTDCVQSDLVTSPLLLYYSCLHKPSVKFVWAHAELFNISMQVEEHARITRLLGRVKYTIYFAVRTVVLWVLEGSVLLGIKDEQEETRIKKEESVFTPT